MKKFLIFLVLAFSSGAAYATQLDQTAAVNRVLALLPSGDVTDDLEISIGKPDNNTFLLVADPTPNANWGHKVYYYYMPAEYTGSTPTVSKTETQYWLPKNVALSKIYYNEDNENELVYPFIERPVTTRDVPAATHQYAIIISGGLNRNYNYSRYWNDCSYIYRVMRKYYNVPKENIYLAMSDGTDPGYDMASGSQNLDLDADGVNDIEYAATLEDLGIIFNSLKEKLTPSDHLFIYVIDHGGYDEQLQSSYICLWNEESLYPEDLNAWLDDLTVGSINCVFGQCFSGGFIDPLISDNRIIATACAEDESSWASSNKRYDAFVETWTSSLMNISTFNNKNVKVDSDNDGHINMNEAFKFANSYDECGPKGTNKETPQYFSGNDNLENNLCFDRSPEPFELMIRKFPKDNGITSTTARIINDSPDIWVRKRKDGKNQHQDPICTTSGKVENYVYVKVSNIGLFDYDPSTTPRYLHLNWAKAAAAHKYTSFTGQYTDTTGQRIGSAIQSILIDKTIPAGGQYTFCIPWRTHGYEAELENSPKSILATISDKPYGLAYDVTRKYYPTISQTDPGIKNRYYKGMAIKSSATPTKFETDSVTGLKSVSWPIALQSLSNERKAYKLAVIRADDVDIYNHVNIVLELPKGLWETYTPLPTSENASFAPPIHRIVGNFDSVRTLYSENDQLKYLIAEGSAFKQINFKAILTDTGFKGDLSAAIILSEYPNDDIIVGSYTLNFKVGDDGFETYAMRILTNDMGNNIYSLTPDKETLDDAEQLQWFDQNNNLLGTGENIEVNAIDVKEVKLTSISADNNIKCCSIQLTPKFEISSAIRNRNDSSITVNLNMPAEHGMSLRIQTLNEASGHNLIPLDPGEKSCTFNSNFISSDILIISLEREGNIISSIILR